MRLEPWGAARSRAAFLSARRGVGCLVVFALPFLLIGLFAAVELVLGLVRGESLSGMPPAFALVFALAFGGFGVVMIGGGRYALRKLAESLQHQEARPTEPWLWRDDWAANRVDSRMPAGATFIAVFAFLWNVISAPILFVLPDELEKGNQLALIGLAFPLVGVALIIWAVRMAIRRRKYGGTHVALDRVPIVPGARLEATLHARFEGGPPDSVSLRLSCVHRSTTGSGDDRRVAEKVLWQDAREIPGEEIGLDFGAARVPVSFDIPSAAPAATPRPDSDGIVWRLDAAAEAPGVDFLETFDLPVFAAGDAAEPAVASLEELAERMAAAEDATPAERPDEPTILIRPAFPTGLEFISAPGRNRAPLLPAVLFLAVWFGFVALFVTLGAPAIFPILFSLVGLLVLVIVLDLAFGTTHTLVARDRVTIRTRILGIGGTRQLPTDQIRAVIVRVGMSQGRSAMQTQQAWQDVEVRWGDRGRAKAARHIPTRAEAEWVAAELRKAIGLA